MTSEEAKAHFTKLAQTAGLDKDATAVVLQAMENDKFRGELTQGYKRHEEYSRDLDALRTEKERLATWYEKEEMPKYRKYTESLEELDRYRKAGGASDDQGLNNGGAGGGAGGRGGGASTGLTKQEVEDMLRQRDAAYVGLTKTAVRISADYTRRFNETLDVDAVEKLALEKGLPLDQAYTSYIAPKEQVAMEARHAAAIEAAKVEAVRDYQSKNHIPVDTKPKEAHPYFDRASPKEGASELDADRNSQAEFMKGWNTHVEELIGQNK